MATTATSSESALIYNTTTRTFIKGAEDAVVRNRVLLNRLQKRGKIKYNVSGDGFQWQVRKGRGNVSVNNGAQPTTFAPTNRHVTAFLDDVGYLITDSVSKREKLKNRGSARLVDRFGQLLDWMKEDIDDTMASELYIDSSATGNTGKLSGLHTMMAATQTVSVGTTTSTVARTANAADPVCYPSDTYAGVLTELGQLGGTWNANWPFGSGDASFDAFTPLIVNSTSTYFDGSSATWANNCYLAVQFGIIHSRKNGTGEGQANLALFDSESYRQLRAKMDPKERVIVNQGSMDRNYGTEHESIWIDGCEVTWEFGMPTTNPATKVNRGFGFNLDSTELMSMQENLFEPGEVIWDKRSRCWLFDVDFLGQLKFKSPRNFVNWIELA